MIHPPKARCKWAESVMKLYHNHYVIHHPWISYLWSFFNSPTNSCSLIDVQFYVKDHHFFFAAILRFFVATQGSCNNEADDLMKPWEYTPKNLTWNLAISRFPKRNLLFQVSIFQVPCGRFRGCLGIIAHCQWELFFHQPRIFHCMEWRSLFYLFFCGLHSAWSIQSSYNSTSKLEAASGRECWLAFPQQGRSTGVGAKFCIYFLM